MGGWGVSKELGLGVLGVVGLLAGAAPLGAQAPQPAPDSEAGWSVGTSLTYPIVRIFRTNRPPRFDEDIESPIFVPQLILGVKFRGSGESRRGGSCGRASRGTGSRGTRMAPYGVAPQVPGGPYSMEWRPMTFPSVSAAITMKPNSPMDIFSWSTFPPLEATRAPSTAQSSHEK